MSCIKVTFFGQGRDKSRNEKLLWQSTGFAYFDNDKNKAAFKLSIPDNLLESTLNREGIYWSVVFTVSFNNNHFKRQFEIPVFKTGEQSNINLDSKNHPVSKDYASELINDVTEFSKDHHTYKLNFPNFRIFQTFIFTGFFVGASLLSLAFYSISYQELPILFSMVTFLFGSIFIGVSLFEGFYSLKVELSPTKITSMHKWLGITFKKVNVSKEFIHNFLVQDYVSLYKEHGKHTAYYKIVVVDNNNKKTTIAIRLKSTITAEQMKSFFINYYKLEKHIKSLA